MEKTSNTSVEAGDTFRGPSGYEDVTGDAVGPEGPAARLLGLGGLGNSVFLECVLQLFSEIAKQEPNKREQLSGAVPRPRGLREAGYLLFISIT